MFDTPILNRLRKLAEDITAIFDKRMERYDNPKHIHEFEGWTDTFWKSDTIRKCHLKIIEPIEGKPKLWLMHINIFPNTNECLPILGLDVVSGPNKISGSFFDFSPVTDETNPMVQTFAAATSNLVWKKERELPPWAQEIFSPHMVAAGNVREEETEQFCETALNLIQYYVMSMYSSDSKAYDTKAAHNKYCINQKKNQQLWSSLRAMKLDSDKIDQYVNNVLFEEIR